VDVDIAAAYAGLVDDLAVREVTLGRIKSEYQRSRTAVLRLTGRESLLGNVPWLAAAVDRRNPYLDVLNLLQVEAFRRLRAEPAAPEAEDLRHQVRLTIQGIASGLRTTG
jgi:phosphoenolpyruvate carboxylase